MNDAERAAEEILQEAYPEARAELCPQGKDCGVHFRKDEEFVSREAEYARLVTYVGEFVVVTDDNPELPMILAAQMLQILNGVMIGDKLDFWETVIFHVGDGVLADVDTQDKVIQALRYSHTHNDWDAVREVHRAVVEGLQAGVIDVSKPLEA